MTETQAIMDRLIREAFMPLPDNHRLNAGEIKALVHIIGLMARTNAEGHDPLGIRQILPLLQDAERKLELQLTLLK